MTFSIVGCDIEKRYVGIAIATSSIAVGSRCPWVRTGVGAVATQNITDPSLGPRILDLIESGLLPQVAVEKMVRACGHIEYRQITVVDIQGNIAHFTGRHTLGINAVSVGSGCVAAGNLLASSEVPSAMVKAFETRDSSNHLAESLLQSLEAGIAAGGEQGEVHSAALLMAGQHSWPEVDLRVDWQDDAVGCLRCLWVEFAPQCADYLLRAESPGDAPSYGVPGDP